MQILAVTPIAVPEDELKRRQERYTRLAPAGLTVTLHNLGTGSSVPRALETDDDVAASEAAVTGWFAAADPDGVDAFLPDCVLDPGVGPGAREQSRPMLGLTRLGAGFLDGAGATFGAVARNEAIARELDRKVASYGLGLHEPVSVLGLTLADIADDAGWSRAVDTALTGLSADYVLNACSAVNLARREAGGPVLVDPTALALRLAGLLASVGSGPGAARPGQVPA
ncbi:hypothetical protein MUK71_03520 [Arthrobacter zhangbolii]|uniref:Hydantoin racemase n=1 Tax=Arthrobacter zhangbolii TaxID=2886936 RepID=A0A9X1M8Q4_9MICC|nr:hypothetical protein [Arthrobacter zhangbolii]MCC3273291.1 hypothetical protein [Arthrobacter zhangbolii]UON92726.1 hypothetical protein MUK71_03520 [Arthrobacter zhangbolii]